MERVLIDRISGDFPDAGESTFHYLVGFYNRTHEESKKIANMKDRNLKSEMESVVKQAKKLCVSYCMIHLANSELFSSRNSSSGSGSPLLPLIFAEGVVTLPVYGISVGLALTHFVACLRGFILCLIKSRLVFVMWGLWCLAEAFHLEMEVRNLSSPQKLLQDKCQGVVVDPLLDLDNFYDTLWRSKAPF
ncbi:hypothetical protein RIF29_24587 [Crotalaria pallida]|uniref:Uncharacterized protein n=1 Tax=Crotalaria pallida TaxID=3830 RepID=A0AAN9ESA9_CROPI